MMTERERNAKEKLLDQIVRLRRKLDRMKSEEGVNHRFIQDELEKLKLLYRMIA